MSTRPVKIAHIITKLAVGGAQKSVLATCTELSPDCFDQMVLAGPEVDAEGSLFTDAGERGVAVRVVPSLVRPLRPWKDVVAFCWLIRWMRRERPDLVHTHSSKAGFVGRAAAGVVGIPVVHSVHGWSFNGEMHPALRRAVILAERVAARVTKRLVVVASSDRVKGLDAAIGHRGQYRLVRNGIDVGAFAVEPIVGRQVRLDLGIPPSARLVGTVGRLAEQKDPIVMARAMAEVIRELPDVWFVWVGDGPLREDMRSEVAELGIADRFLFAGVRRDVPAVLAALDVFVLSSRWEGLPITVTEAMAAGVPVVATAVDGCREIITDGATGILVPPAEATTLATAIRQVLLDGALASSMAAAARSGVIAWDRPAMALGLAELYRDVIRSSRRTEGEEHAEGRRPRRRCRHGPL